MGRTVKIGVAAALAAILAGSSVAQTTPPSPNFGIAQFNARKAGAGLRAVGTAEIDGVRIYYETYGAGPPVLVLHGGTAYLETMHHQIEALAKDHLVIAPDSRAHGRSTDGPGPLHYHRMAEDMIALMGRLGMRKFDLVGWSDGGIIGLDLAIHHPDRVGRIVTMGANYDLTGLSNTGPPQPHDGPATASVRAAYQRLSSTPDHWPEFYAKVNHMWRTEPHYSLGELGRIASPVLVMAGEFDSVRREHTDALAAAIPGARKVIVPEANHFAPLSHPDAVNAAIVEFLGQKPAP